MILVDTSVWIRKFLGREGFADELEQLLTGNIVGGHEMVHGERLAGHLGGRAEMLCDYRQLSWAKPLEHASMVAWVRVGKLCGCGAGWVDLHLLAAAQAAGWLLWTADARLADLAAQLKLAWHPW